MQQMRDWHRMARGLPFSEAQEACPSGNQASHQPQRKEGVANRMTAIEVPYYACEAGKEGTSEIKFTPNVARFINHHSAVDFAHMVYNSPEGLLAINTEWLAKQPPQDQEYITRDRVQDPGL